MKARLGLFTLATVLIALGAQAQQDETAPLNENEIKRVVLPADRLAVELERARHGALEKMELDEFEGRVRRYREARQARPSVPRLVDAVYKARLNEGSSRRAEPWLGGTAQWTLLHPGPGPGILPLQ